MSGINCHGKKCRDTEEIRRIKTSTLSSDTFRHFHYHNILGKAIRVSSQCAVREVLIWAMARIPTTIEQNGSVNWEDMFSRWQKLKKTTSHRTEAKIAKETEMVENLKNLGECHRHSHVQARGGRLTIRVKCCT